MAVGRRLGYPLKLVTTKGHLFVRWEGAGERFNIGNRRSVPAAPVECGGTWDLSVLPAGRWSDMLPVMPRVMRVEYPGAICHVMDRGDGNQ